MNGAAGDRPSEPPKSGKSEGDNPALRILVEGAPKPESKKPLAKQSQAQFDDLQHWRSGIAEVRATARWMIAALGAAATVIFGAGPLVARGEIPSQDFAVVVFWVVCAALVGAIAVSYIIAKISAVILPARSSLSQLPSPILKEIQKNPSLYLPAGCASVAEFRKWRQETSLAHRSNIQTLAVLSGDLKTAKEELKSEQDQAKKDALAKRISEVQDEINGRSAARATLAQNLDVAERAKARLILRAEYFAARDLYSGSSTSVGIAAVFAAVAAVVYTVAWSYQAADPVPSVNDHRVGTIARMDTEAGLAFWQAVGFNDCLEGDTTTVIVRSGVGTSVDPYLVSTAGVDDCPLASFSVIADVAVVTIAEARIDVRYMPLPAE